MISIEKNNSINLDGFKQITKYEITDVEDDIIYVTDKTSGKEGFINISVKNILDIQDCTCFYDELDKFHDGIAIFKMDNKYGLIDKTGKQVIQPIAFDDIKKLDDQVYALERITDTSKKVKLCNIKTRSVTKERFQDYQYLGHYMYQVTKSNKTFLLNNNLKMISSGHRRYEVLNDQFIYFFDDDRMGIINCQGKIILDSIFHNIQLLDNYFIVTKDKKQGIYSLEGNEIIEPKYYKILEVKDNCFSYQKNKKMIIGIKNLNEEDILKPKNEFVRIINNHKFIVRKNHNKYFCLLTDKEEKMFIDNDTYFYDRYKNGVAFAKKIGGDVLVDESLDPLIPPYRKYKEIANGIYLCTNFTDNIIYNAISNVSTNSYQEIVETEQGLYSIYDQGYGLLDSKGNLLVEPIYDDRIKFNGDYAFVSRNNKWGVIDRQGKEIIKCENELDKFSTGQVHGSIVEVNKHFEGISLYNLNGEQIIKDLSEFKYIFILNDELLIIDNYLIPISEIKTNYNLEISYRDTNNKMHTSYHTFEREEQRNKTIKMLENTIVETMNDLDNHDKNKVKKMS